MRRPRPARIHARGMPRKRRPVRAAPSARSASRRTPKPVRARSAATNTMASSKPTPNAWPPPRQSRNMTRESTEADAPSHPQKKDTEAPLRHAPVPAVRVGESPRRMDLGRQRLQPANPPDPHATSPRPRTSTRPSGPLTTAQNKPAPTAGPLTRRGQGKSTNDPPPRQKNNRPSGHRQGKCRPSGAEEPRPASPDSWASRQSLIE